jgi:dihydropteroate synthase
MPVMVGTSRKSFLARIIADTDDSMAARDDSMVARDDATLATSVWCFEQGAALVRVHDVAGSRRAVALLETMDRATPEGIAA